MLKHELLTLILPPAFLVLYAIYSMLYYLLCRVFVRIKDTNNRSKQLGVLPGT